MAVPTASLPATLTPRQWQVLDLLCRTGMTRTEIGAALGISPATVKVHMQGIAERMEIVPRPCSYHWLLPLAFRLGVLAGREEGAHAGNGAGAHSAAGAGTSARSSDG